MRMGSPIDGCRRLFNLRDDPTEGRDPSVECPDPMGPMPADRGAHDPASGVILPEAGDDPAPRLLRDNWPLRLRMIWFRLTAVLAAPAPLAWVLSRQRR